MKTAVYINGCLVVSVPGTNTVVAAPDGMKLMRLIRDTKFAKDGCFDWCSANIRQSVLKGWRGHDTTANTPDILIETYVNDSYRNIDHRGKCGCHPRNAQECIKSLVAGKCKDEFMRNTVGATLWPELYRDLKQKTK